VLSDRLRRLVAAGVLTTRPYRAPGRRSHDEYLLTEAGILATRPYQVPGSRMRTEYLLTDAGVDLVPLLSAMSDWGERHLGPGSTGDVVYRHAGCGGKVSARLVCECGEETGPHDRLVAEINR
jgi:DNA-binding HxlR family transcriptional regulator